MKNELVEMLCQKSVRFTAAPTIKLVSGRMSRFYVNCKPTILDPYGMFLVGHLVFDALRHLKPAGVGGLTFGADPIAIATAFASHLKQEPVKAFSIRKEKKDHGIVKWLEGDLEKGSRVIIIDDVATTGGSTIKAITRARAEGMDVIKAIVLVDRQEGGLENIQKEVPDASALITREELLKRWKTKDL